MDSPVTVIMRCDQTTAIGLEVVRGWDPDYCIVAIEVYLVLYNGDTYGSTQFKTFADYQAYVASKCRCCTVPCILTINCCTVLINGCIGVAESSQRQCDLFINDCHMAINGQNIHFFSNN